ncbi:hypothetical protein M0D69_03910 [Caballeronia sp. SEWSISQ10-4 2]|uniref:hypothetical protein n=1 Tax=Caballeronia sp. SEWSISQ10-4 2 TaxID=2937438 RepID=UPI00264AE9BD|nr:hypothetical protein [Caballeronia sp. SEWSISQ10-4 2]MDN7177169.1 hypothetical protein [Caballeronia sp. SEWSISQ10-4 2]
MPSQIKPVVVHNSTWPATAGLQRWTCLTVLGKEAPLIVRRVILPFPVDSGGIANANVDCAQLRIVSFGRRFSFSRVDGVIGARALQVLATISSMREQVERFALYYQHCWLH